jgi:hypothetical protein
MFAGVLLPISAMAVMENKLRDQPWRIMSIGMCDWGSCMTINAGWYKSSNSKVGALPQ